MKIDPRLPEDNDTPHPGEWLQAKLTVIIDVWVAEYLSDPAVADARLRQNGLVKVADRLVEIFGEEWWNDRKNPSVGAISQALKAQDEQMRESA